MNEEKSSVEGQTPAVPVVDLSEWKPVIVPSAQANLKTETPMPIQSTHPAVVAVCDVLMIDSPAEDKLWHSLSEHARTRDTMLHCINHLILQRRPTASQDWIDKLPEVSKRIERNLYYSAASLEEYSDPYTLVARIQGLVKVLIAAAATLPVKAEISDHHNSREGFNDRDGGEGDDEDDEGDSDSDNVVSANAEPPALSTRSPTASKRSTGTPLTESKQSAQVLELTSAPLPASGQSPLSVQGTSSATLVASTNGSTPSQTLPLPLSLSSNSNASSLGLSAIAGLNNFTSVNASHKSDLLHAPLYLAPLKEAEYAQEQAAASSMQAPSMYLASRQVSSQGCSRVFIIKVLISVSEFVKGKSLPSIFTFKRELVMDWLISAKQACCMPTIMAEEGYYGGPPFVDPDPSTHWSEPHQLYTWWKNNVERRSKFKVLQEDAKYKGLDPKRLQRARWCEAVVALSEVIRASSGSTNASRTTPSSGVSGGSSNSSVGNPTFASAYVNGLTGGSSFVYGFVPPPPDSLPSVNSAGMSSAASSVVKSEESATSGIDVLVNMRNQQAQTFLTTYGASSGMTPAQIAAAGPPALPLAAPINSIGDSNSFPAPAKEVKKESSVTAGMNQLAPLMPLEYSQHAAAVSMGSEIDSDRNSHNKIENAGASDAFAKSLGSSGNANTAAGTSLQTVNTADSLSGSDMRPHYVMNQFRNLPVSAPRDGNNSQLTSHLIPGTNIPYRNYSNTFPVKLFDLVSTEDETVVGWQGQGSSFQVRNMDKFVNEILPKHFKHNNFTSFQRQLNLYGFRRSASYDKGAYYHPQFQQGQRELAESIRRVLVPSSNSTSNSNNTESVPMSMGMPMGLGRHIQHQYSLHGMAGMGMPFVGMQQGVHGMTGVHPLHEQHMGARGHSSVDLKPSSTSEGKPVETGKSSVANASTEGYDVNENSSIPWPPSNSTIPNNTFQMLPWMQTPGNSPPYYATNTNGVPQYNSNMYWQLAMSNMASAGMSSNANPYFMPGGYLSNQYPGAAQYAQYGAYPAMDGTYENSYGYAANSGPYNVMSQLARNFYPASAKLKVPARGYNRNSKRSMHDKTEGETKTKMSARDRKMLDMNSAGGEFNAEQFLEGTDLTERYNLGGTSLLGVRQYRRKKGVEGTEDEDGTAGKKIRGRPRARKGEDDGDDLDGVRRGPKRGKARKKTGGYDDEDSISSGSVMGGKNGKGRLGSRTSSLRNMTSTPDILLRSGLSRNSSIAHYLEGCEEDVLDLRNPRKRRVHLDFIVPTLDSVASIRGDDPNEPERSLDEPDYVCGFYHGELHFGKKDLSLHYKLHGSRALPDVLLKQSDRTAAAASPVQSLATMIAAQNECNAPRSTRVGDEYQCDIPALQSLPSQYTNGGVARRSVTSATDGLVWKPDTLTEESVDNFFELLRSRKRLIPLVVGSVLVVHLSEENAYRLCCVLDVYMGDQTPRPLAESTPRTPAAPLMDASVRVFDGYEEWVVPAVACMTFNEGETEKALQLLSNHHGEISAALVQEVDWMLQQDHDTRRDAAIWSSEEVQRFCNAVKRHGDNIKKVWELKFRDSKSVDEVQEFFLRIYPHTQLGGAKRMVNIYYRGELAAVGFPDGEQSGSDGAGDDDDDSDSNDDSSVNSISNDASDGETPDAVDPVAFSSVGETDKRTAVVSTTGVTSTRRGRSQVEDIPVYVKASSSTGALSSALAVGTSSRRASSSSNIAATSSASIVVSSAIVDATSDAAERRSSRKRNNMEEVAPSTATSTSTSLGVNAPKEETKRRRR